MEDYNQLCVWPATIVGEEDKKEFIDFMKDTFDVRVKYYTEVLTNPDIDEDGNEVEDTGGRNDLLFHVHNDDIGKFAVNRLSYGIRWWEDVIKYNDNSHLYSKEFLNDNPPKW